MPSPVKFSKDSFVRNLAKGNILVPFLERYDDWDRPFTFEYTPKEGDDGWHPSGDCCPPVMDLYEKATGQAEQEKISPSLQRTFLVGHFWHQVVQDALVRLEFARPESIERKGRHVWGEEVLTYANCTMNCIGGHSENCEAWRVTGQRPKSYHYATGSGDVAPLEMPNWTGIMDIKTMRSQDWERLYKTGQLPQRFAAKYRCQINCYMDFFDQERGMILAVNKDSSGFAEITFERDQELIDTIYQKWEYVSECIEFETPPDPEADEIFDTILNVLA